MLFRRLIAAMFAVIAVLAPSFVGAQGGGEVRTHSVRRHIAAAVTSIKGVIVERRVGIYWSYVSFHIPTPMPPGGGVIERQLVKPDGSTVVLYPPSANIDAGWPVQGVMWEGAFPQDWKGIYTFEVFVTTAGVRTLVCSEKVSVGLLPLPLVGPLESAEPNSDGSITLKGVFPTPPVVVAPEFGNVLVPVEGSYFIPASAGLSGEVVIGVCSGVPLDCTTRVVYIPAQ